MERKFLEDLGLEATTADRIFAEHGKSTQSLRTELETAKAQLGAANTTLSEANKQIEAFKGMDVEGIKKAADEWKAAAEQAKKDSDTQIKALQFDFALDKALSAAQVKDPKVIMPLLKREALKLADDGIVGLKEQLEPLTQSHAYLFAAENDSQQQFVTMPSGIKPKQQDMGAPQGKAAQWDTKLAEARKNNDSAAAISIKMQAAAEGVILN